MLGSRRWGSSGHSGYGIGEGSNTLFANKAKYIVHDRNTSGCCPLYESERNRELLAFGKEFVSQEEITNELIQQVED